MKLMRVKFSLSSKMLIALLFAEIALALASVFVFLKLDSVVNSTLYEFGLQFSYVWAQQYWLYSELILGSLGVVIVLTCITVAYAQISTRSGVSPKFGFIGAFILAATAANATSAFFFTRLDQIVHGDLYFYGLQFSYAWANQYWTYARLLLGFIGLVIMLNSGLIGYSFKPSAINVTLSKLTKGLLLTGGSFALILSVILESSILAFIGLGLVFWGAIMLYVEPQEYIPENIAAMMTAPLLVDLNKMVQGLGYHGKAFYLPSEYLKDRESSKVYICQDADAGPPTRKSVSEHEGSVFLNSPKAVVIEPPGIELSRLFEKTLGTKFANADIQFIQDNLTDLIVEDLGIAQGFRMSVDGNRIHVVVQGMIYKSVSKEVRNLSGLYGRIGCPISSALGCAFAKAASKLVTIDRELISEDGSDLDVEYVMLDESAE